MGAHVACTTCATCASVLNCSHIWYVRARPTPLLLHNVCSYNVVETHTAAHYAPPLYCKSKKQCNVYLVGSTMYNCLSYASLAWLIQGHTARREIIVHFDTLIIVSKLIVIYRVIGTLLMNKNKSHDNNYSREDSTLQLSDNGNCTEASNAYIWNICNFSPGKLYFRSAWAQLSLLLMWGEINVPNFNHTVTVFQNFVCFKEVFHFHSKLTESNNTTI